MKHLWQIWQLPITLIMWLFYALPFWAFRQHEYVRREGWVVIFRVRTEKDNWYIRKWGNWTGQSGPNYMLLVHAGGDLRRHELRHTKQWLILGILFPFVYYAFHLYFGYYNNPLEVDARAAEKRRLGK